MNTTAYKKENTDRFRVTYFERKYHQSGKWLKRI